MFEDAVNIIAQIGFPSFISLYCLMVINKSMKENTETNRENASMIKQLKAFLEAKL